MSETRMFTKSHEWIQKLDETTVLTGLSKHAVDEMGDLVFINLPVVGSNLVAGEVMADVESVKAVSDVYSPVSGVVQEVNEELVDAPEKLNETPYDAWIAKISNVTGFADMMDATQYDAFVKVN